jgi:hypothetical protein
MTNYFKIFTVIFMIVISFLLYNLYSEKSMEKFENSGVGADTTKAITDLGNIAKQLLAGGATVPGNLTVTGGLNLTGALNSPSAIINGRNILAELDKLNSRWNGDNLTVAGQLTVNNGSSFNGGRHYFQDEEKAGRLRVGGVYGRPGIWNQDAGDVGGVQIANFQVGTRVAGSTHTSGMVGNKKYDYIQSGNPSYAILGPSQTGNLGMAWNDGRMYWTFLSKNERTWNDQFGALPY